MRKQTEPKDILLENQFNLTFLDLSENGLRSLPPQTLQNKSKLKTLILARNSFSRIPDYVNSLKTLEYLDFSANNLSSISNMNMELPNLKVFNISYNYLKKLWDSSCNFPKISSLVYSVNEKSFGFEIVQALFNKSTSSTVYMDFSNEALSARRDQLKAVESLFLNFEDLEKSEIEFTTELDAMTNLKFLDLKFNVLKEHDYTFSKILKIFHKFSFIIENNPNLEYLSLHGWLTSSTAYPSLKTLKISECYAIFQKMSPQTRSTVTGIFLPPENRNLFNVLRNCSKLVTIHIVHCFLKDIHPDAFIKQTLLEELNLSNNTLTTLPIGIFRSLHNLRILQLENNQIREIPNLVLDNLNNLFELNLKGNKLLSFDE